MYLLLGFLKFSGYFFAMARYFPSTVNFGTVFPKNVLEACWPQKGSVTVCKATFLWIEGLQNTFLEKTVPRLTVNRKYLAIAKNQNGKSQKPQEKIHFAFFILEFSMSTFFHETKSGSYFYQGCVIILSYFELLCNYHKRPQRKKL